MKSDIKIALIGAGKVGNSLQAAFQKSGYAANLASKDVNEQKHACTGADFILLTVQDRQIESVCQAISPWLKPETIVAHCSGSLDCQPLETAKALGCHVGTAHPLNSFPTLKAAIKTLQNDDHGTACFISGFGAAPKFLSGLFKNIGFKPMQIDDDQKVAYHAACVFLCNYLTSLAEIGLSVARQAGLEQDSFWRAVQPLMLTTLSNISQNGTANALSGPIARGDLTTVNAHLGALRESPALVEEAYRLLGKQAIQLSKLKGDLNEDTLKQLMEIL